MRKFMQLCFNKRFRRILFLFLNFVMQFWWLSKIKRFLSPQKREQRYKELYKRQAQEFTITAMELGALLIKLGQFFSARVDILPKEYTDELSKLQDSVKPVGTELIIARINAELGNPEEHFSFFAEEPIAAASLGQVHRATLKTGENVAVKILRPGIEDIIQVDVEALKIIVALSKRNERLSAAVDLDQVYKEFTAIVFDELDYVKEGANADLFRENFSADPSIKIPQIHWDLTTQNVLTMEFVEGIKITEFENLQKFGLDLNSIASKFYSVFLEQIMTQRIFHADPHPGNILVNKEGQLILLDFGMVDRIDENMEKDLINLALNVYKKNAPGIVNSFDSMGFLRPSADKNTLIKSVTFLLKNLFEDQSGFNTIDIEELGHDLRELMISQPFQIPSGTLFLGKALATTVGICNGLDKNFDMVKAASPFIKDVLSGESETSGQGIFIDQAKKTLTTLIVLPEKLNTFIEGIQSGEIRLQPAKSFERNLLEQQEQQFRKVILAILTSGLILSGSILLNGEFVTIGKVLMVLGGLLILKLLIGRGSSTGKVKRRPGRSRKSMGSGFKKPRFHP
jgi:predicted unusual protein kinase regulating ubiquinone biosynthesis (AarF/ABC1/UbiB family)